MKVETVITLSEELAVLLDGRAPTADARSQVVEAALRAYLAWPHAGEDRGDLAIINANAAALNEEAEDVLSYQVFP